MELNLSNCIIDSVSTKSDKSIKIVLVTRELPAEEIAGLFLYLHLEVKKIKADVVEEQEKSPSKRLKDRLYVYFKEKNGTDKGFQPWYENVLDEIGRKYLDMLEPKS